MNLSIIIPALNEEAVIENTLKSLANHSLEIIVVDGGSSDNTIDISQRYTSHVLSTPPFRGLQQDMGARYASGNVLLFLHADTLLPRGFINIIEEIVFDPNFAFGAFCLSIYPSTPGLKLISLGANIRSTLFKLPYGDQAIFMRKTSYLASGGFRNLPIMEDVDLVSRIKKLGQFRLVRKNIVTSARRWQKEGLLFTTLRNWLLIIRYFMGESPRSLLRYYSDIR
ncbi:MAG: TIGR04283 family arsenosugar biosynthesis glycosyltransferase [Deltaproteobacteria bacterium]|jgi:rSAM/selenodomain-associated transferase 2|nr:TIGR04283 family arsenosugar biosynthesis glycosyltransferase [Deltaproteobacteria bacterium]